MVKINFFLMIAKSDLLTLSHNGGRGEGWLATTLALLPGTEVQSTMIEPSMWAGEPASRRCEAFDLHALSHTIGVGVRYVWPHTQLC